MKRVTLYAVLTATGIASGCTAMQDSVAIKDIKGLNTGARLINLVIASSSASYNGEAILVDDDEAIIQTFETVADQLQARYAYVSAIWQQMSSKSSPTLFGQLQTASLDEMKLIKRILWKIYDAPYCQRAFRKAETRTHDYFVRMLNLFEQMHDLRIEVCRAWLITDNPPELVSQVLVSTSIERNFQDYADVLEAHVNVEPWFKRMRNNDL